MKKVLVAEDSVVNRELIRELLEIHDYAVYEAGDGQQALEKINEVRPDILLLDLGMPVLDGYGTIARIRENSELQSLPVLAVTAYAMHGDREKILAAGFDGYISKPINSKILFEELERLLKLRHPEN
jgi:two-component system cell cycle response regulator DivK